MVGFNVQTFRFISFQCLVRYDIRFKLYCVSLEKWRTLFKAIISQFKYCPLVWMFDGRQINHKTNRLHELALWIVYNDFVSSIQDVLNKKNLFKIHHQNIQSSAIKIYNTLNNLLCFECLYAGRTDSYSLLSEQELIIPKVSTTIPCGIRNTESYNKFNSKTNRNSYRRCSLIKGLLRNFAKFIGKKLCQSLY